ncbi:hypothetical protein [Paludisphaera borealis]|uniref:Uncharacterized protein n=1 Tax=Paludisphaera borealis TaxID=1387353 RepID=A0A1U7CNG6_9BACT|nr:hypothetical protein [Paludisphaera borealis]APW60484.1 hypothetical protein BSF38_01954 [Paludisphaera borealis]
MATDNVELSAGSGGATLRTLAGADGTEWPASVVAYATTVSPGANVLQPVTPANPLPVSATLVGTLVVDAIVGSVQVVQSTPADLQCTASIASGQTLDNVTTVGTITNPVAVTQSGSWTSTATQSTASALLCTASQGGSWTVAATQSGTWTANQGGSWTVAATQSGTWNVGVTGSVTVAQSTPGNLLATVSIASAQTLANVTTVGTITNPVTVAQATAANLNATVSIAAAQTLATVTTVGTVNTLTSITNAVTVTQPTAANLKCTANIATGQTLDTVTNVTTVGAVTSVTNPVTVAQPTAANLNATATLAAGTNLIGKTSASAETSTVYNGATALTPLFARFLTSTSGKTTIVAAAGSGKQIRVLRYSLSSFGDVTATLWSGTSAAISGSKYLTKFAAAGGAYCPVGVCQTAANEALTVDLSAAVATSGEVTYVVVG